MVFGLVVCFKVNIIFFKKQFDSSIVFSWKKFPYTFKKKTRRGFFLTYQKKIKVGVAVMCLLEQCNQGRKTDENKKHHRTGYRRHYPY